MMYRNPRWLSFYSLLLGSILALITLMGLAMILYSGWTLLYEKASLPVGP